VCQRFNLSIQQLIVSIVFLRPGAGRRLQQHRRRHTQKNLCTHDDEAKVKKQGLGFRVCTHDDEAKVKKQGLGFRVCTHDDEAKVKKQGLRLKV
jgi:hypothetical protein